MGSSTHGRILEYPGIASCVLISLAMLIHKQATVDVLTALLHNAPMLFSR